MEGNNNVNLDSDGSGILVLTGAVTNAITLSKTLFIGGSNTGANEIQGELKDNGANTLSLIKRGTGRWILSGTNTYSGSTTVEDGTLEIGSGGVMAITNNITYTVDGVLSINGETISNSTDMTFSGGGLIKQQAGLLCTI
ncbi:MAG: autotransporter-associated beta strand repeat-containing protein [Kiritimatiellae bacterium]|jgi:fibronectin-binding autotransporter adhesin|nr:autotransporter-associated beta strand repeat-containing protein [Kiritimatiellia bacterium]